MPEDLILDNSHEPFKAIFKNAEDYFGFRILSSVNEFAPQAEIILAHYKRWDGTGYPKGLKGEEIPRAALPEGNE